MNRIKTLVRKEILDILRDRKTLVVMVAVPVLLYPLILIGMTFVFSMIYGAKDDEVYTVGYPAAYEELADGLRAVYGEWLDDQEEEDRTALEFDAMVEGEASEEQNTWLEVAENPDGTLDVTVCYNSVGETGGNAESVVMELLGRYSEELSAQRIREAGLDMTLLHPITFASEDQATISESMGVSLGGSIGMMLIVTILLGAMYPAIDATAGEKERGTLETLLTLPVSNFQMILSKFLSVSLFACVTAVISLLSLGGSVLFLMYGLADSVAQELPGFSPGTIITMLPVLLVTMIATALLCTAICMCFCVFAKSFKEANNYVTPVMLVIMFASMAAMVPTVELTYTTSMIPIVNVSLLVKQIISQQFDMTLAGITILVNLMYSILIVWILAKIYDSEDILFSDGFRSFRLFQKRENIRPGTVPDLGDLAVAIVVLFLLLLYVGTAASVRLGFWGTVVNEVCIIAVPVFFVWYMKSDYRALFSLRAPRLAAVPGSVLLYIGTYCLVLAASSVLLTLFPDSAQNLEIAFSPLVELPFGALVLVMALLPAVCEEVLFRGFLFGSLRRRFDLRWAVLISSLVFGAFHMSLVKLLPTAMLGAAFAVIASVSGSLYIGMALHFINNAFSAAAMKYPEAVGRVLPFMMQETFETAELLLLAGIGVVLAGGGALLLRRAKRKE